jgi:hypothetical protein
MLEPSMTVCIVSGRQDGLTQQNTDRQKFGSTNVMFPKALSLSHNSYTFN